MRIWAHRGASRAERENTLRAFVRARELGADGVELDVRRTRDGALVVHHDPRLPDGRPIIDNIRVELPGHVPTLADALAACAGMDVNVEIKNDPQEPDFDPADTIADATVGLLLDCGEPHRWLVSSFRIETVDRCRALADARGAPIRTAWLTEEVPDGAPELLVARGHVAIHPDVRTLTRDAVDACHRSGIAVNTWTCDDPQRMRELLEWGVDGVCTNVPDVALNVVASARRDG